MASTLTVDNIVGATTAANVKLPAGCILQTQTLSRSRSARQTINSTSFAIVNDGVGNFELAITPKFSSSKIIGSFNLSGIATTTNSTSIGFRLYRNGSEIQMLESHFGYKYGELGDRHHFAPTFVDSPNTTSAVTYSVYAAIQASSQSAYIFDTHIGTGSSGDVRHAFILQEVSV